jgi:hypothetical protein
VLAVLLPLDLENSALLYDFRHFTAYGKRLFNPTKSVFLTSASDVFECGQCLFLSDFDET